MSSPPALPNVPRVAAVLVVHNGMEWLSSVLATLASQQYPALDLLVVDNASTDGSGDVLSRRIPEDRLVRLPRNLGFGRAVAAALSHPVVAASDLLLFLHDDLVLAPDAIARLVRALRDDTSLSIVGPKLREWSDDGVLAEIGMSMDRFGRAEQRVERGELDQGQHDRADEVLYVSTAGMLIPREVYRQLGGFDVRFPAYRDDLDLCWRAWLQGHRIEVVPQAVGYHIGAATGRAAESFGGGLHGGRYLAERHSVASLLKNYSAFSLLWVLPATVVLALAKVVAFLLIRRFGEAGAVVRAYLWNVAQLPRTLRRRRAVQRRRAVPDRQVARLFAPGLPRARTYAEAVGAWLAGGSTRALIDDETAAAEEERLAGRSMMRFARERPALVVGFVLLVAYLIGLGSLLGGGQVVGGDIAPWPQAARNFLRAYAAPHNGDPLGSGGFASPIQAVLGLFSFFGLGNPWLAQRLLVFGLIPLAWLLALRAGRLITAEPGPRALGATLYALSPIVLGSLGQGRYGTLVFAALLPGLFLVGVRAVDTRIAPATSWRATALLALGLAVTTAAEPSLGPVLLLGVIGGAIVSARRRRPSAAAATARLGMAVAAALAMLSPWLISLVAGGRMFASAAGTETALPLWRAVTGVPEVVPGVGGLGGILTALMSVAVVAASILLGLRRRPDVVAVLTAVGAGTALAAWAANRFGVDWLWSPSLLLPTALAIGGLGVLAARSAGRALTQHAFGARQLSVVVATAVLGIGLVISVVRVATGPYTTLAADPELVPAFIAADEPRIGPYRVLLLADEDGQVGWDVVSANGPSMVRFGVPTSKELTAALDAAVGGVSGGGDPRAGAGLGALNVRYVVVTADATSPELARALADQPALEPLPSGAGRVYRVRSWLPRAAVLPTGVVSSLASTGDPGNTRRIEERGLDRVDPSTFRGTTDSAGILLLSEAGTNWRATAGGSEPAAAPVEVPLGDGLTLPTWEVANPGAVEVAATRVAPHVVMLVLQILLVLAVISLALRPPGFTQRREQRQRAAGLPRQLTEQAAAPPEPAEVDAEPRP